MKILKSLFITVTLISIIALTGCSSKSANQPINTTENISISKGTDAMRNAIKATKEKLSANDENGAIKTSKTLEENWSKIEDSVKDKNKDLYEKVEVPLDTINGGIKIKPLDTKTLTSSLETLDKVLEEVQNLK